MTPLMSSVERLRRHGRGQLVREEGIAMIEFALVLPLLLLLLLGVVDFGKAFNYKNDETHLANQAARYAAVNSCSACGAQVVNTWIRSQADSNELQDSGPPPKLTVTIVFANNAGKFPGESGYAAPTAGDKNHCVGDPVKVSLSYDYAFMPFLSLGSFTIKGSATMRLEKDWAGTATTGVHSAGSVYDVAPNSASNDIC
jgi:Flp pilus assembly protein TadG